MSNISYFLRYPTVRLKPEPEKMYPLPEIPIPEPDILRPFPFLRRLRFFLKPEPTTVSPILAAFFANMRCCLKPDEVPALRVGEVFAHVRVQLSIIFFILGVEPAYPLPLLRLFLVPIVYFYQKNVVSFTSFGTQQFV